ncbi:TonB-dependent receptor plug domain-containing protein [Candidatus Venteria ishoeyi]|uniref:Colicin I receptor n=1 Tax=Candidatus Venteria ishoeyi TaxID=1899563 RepID=A0A1H6FGF3_9GAMM|nr:TonB-dependent receptor [Candidatus Venteria ishoeyi]MDM8547381.1 TonB-dependent receptor [Candidatus Venteria ishoeyi]SEH08733.1 Colicin I receptor precursor [Candidatus Venteria ishoeyi]
MNKKSWQHKITVMMAVFAGSSIFPLLSSVAAQEDPKEIIQDLRGLSLEQLLEVRIDDIASVARKSQKITETAAAAFVITREDIRRAGITSIPEALRMAPGVQVARLDSSTWAVSIRGLNGRFSSKLLVLIDGRSVYSPTSSGTYWNRINTVMADLERIEIVRGPGGTLWGANAVNGVINIITRHSQDTQGAMLSTSLGQGGEKGSLSARYGGELGDSGTYRFYAKTSTFNGSVDALNAKQKDDWRMQTGGFRADWKNDEKDAFNMQAEVYHSILNSPPLQRPDIVDRNHHNGFFLSGRWQHDLENGNTILQSYFEREKRTEFNLTDSRRIWDIDFQHRFQRGEKQEYVWGLAYRYITDHLVSPPGGAVNYNPPKRQDNLFSAFIQGEWILIPEHWWLTLGTKFEHNDYTGLEVQPSARLLWRPFDKHQLWTSVSRAVHTPSRSNSDLDVSSVQQGMRISVKGNPDLNSEALLAYELGYRYHPSKRFFLDTTVFYNDYKHLIIADIQFSPFPPPPTLNQHFTNDMKGSGQGFELAGQWQIAKSWKLITSYTYLDMRLQALNPSLSSQESKAGKTPQHQLNLRSLWNPAKNWEIDSSIYYVDKLTESNTSAYTRVDLRLGWKPHQNLSVSIGGRNLFDPHHAEFGQETGSTIITQEIPRTWYIQVQYQH